ncbi:impB/mucB/samB family protein [Xylariaceae sp. FL1019]|nr:impB/mucB/samB family protein [Xylariaceae sp. FL1019]
MGSQLERNSNAVRKRIENHEFTDENGEEYGASAFGGFTDYFRRKKIKLQNLDAEVRATSDKPPIFKGVVACVNGYTQPPLHILHRDLVEYGAGFLQYLDGKTMATHIIASALTPKKMIEFRRYRVVKPAWVIDSIKAGKMLPWADYRVVQEGPRQKTLMLDGNGISAQASSPQSTIAGYREQTENSFYTSQLRGEANPVNTAIGQAPTSPGRIPTVSFGSVDDGGNHESNLAAGQDEGSTLQRHSLLEDTQSATHNAPPTVSPMIVTLETNDPVEMGDGDQLVPTASVQRSKPMTSEEHNAILLQDPRMRKSSTANPDFIQQYYSESRLHHLSTWKAELKSQMQKLASEKSTQRKVSRRRPGARRYVMHIDFDSFFCAVSLKKAPDFVDKPAVVAHGTGTGSEIASCNYPARAFGVKNGMWMKRAKELCPDLKVLPYDFPAYEEASKLFYECILDVGGVVQSVSIDEALVDVTMVVLDAVGSDGFGVSEGSIWREQEHADQLAKSLRHEIKVKTGCAVSVGIGDNILLAKVALRKAKPAGQYQIKPEEVQDFLGGLKVSDLPGVAYSISGKLEEIGIKYVNDIRQTSRERLITNLGPKTGEKLWDYARGIDKTEVGDQPVRKSVSAEVNWGIRFISQEEADEFVTNLCKELEKRLLNEGVKGKQLTMKIMRRSLDAPLDPPKHLGHGKCDTFNKSVAFGVATNDHQVLGKKAISILRAFKFSPGDLRGLGVQLTKLESMKTALSGPDGSQKKLTFGTFKTPVSGKKSSIDPIQDATASELVCIGSLQKRESTPDPIIDGPVTPRKSKTALQHPALTITKAGDKDVNARAPLNVGGTQFVMPSNPDLTVLEELPQDIRSRIMAQGRGKSAETKTHEQSPELLNEIPPEFDPDVFHALPDDMKAEILASHRRQSKQTTPKHSPHKDRSMQQFKQMTPSKKRGPGVFIGTKERQADKNAKVAQSNLLFQKNTASNSNDVPELDEDFLRELPEDMRQEIIADHRQRRAQRSGLDIKVNTKREQNRAGALAEGQTRLNFSFKPTKIIFANGLTTVSEIRDMFNVWHRETSVEGPHRRDVEMLEKYLVRVVLEEKDMDKVQKLIRWLEYLTDAIESESSGKQTWREVVSGIKGEVQKAVRSRGLGHLDLE